MDGFRRLTRWCLEDVSVCVVDLSGGLEHLGGRREWGLPLGARGRGFGEQQLGTPVLGGAWR